MSLPEKMRAVLLKDFGDRGRYLIISMKFNCLSLLDNLYIGEADVPKIKVHDMMLLVYFI